jgi:hypothetical protein
VGAPWLGAWVTGDAAVPAGIVDHLAVADLEYQRRFVDRYWLPQFLTEFRNSPKSGCGRPA